MVLRSRRTALLAVGAALHVCSAAVAAPSKQVPITDAAREHFKAGVALLQDPAGERWEEAYMAFKAAYAESPSPKILGNLGLCAMTLERDSEAIQAYTTYLAEAPNIAAAERAQIEKDLVILTSNSTPLELTVAPKDAKVSDARVQVMGPQVLNRYTPVDGKVAIRLRAGHHVITVSKDGFVDEVLDLDVMGTAPVVKKVELRAIGSEAPSPTSPPSEPTPPPEPAVAAEAPDEPVPVSAWAMLATTGALAAGAVVVGVLSLTNHSSYEDAHATYELSRSEADRQERDSIASTGRALNITTDVLIGTAGAAAVVTLVLFLLPSDAEEEGSSPADDAEVPAEAARWHVVPALGPTGAGLGVVRAF